MDDVGLFVSDMGVCLCGPGWPGTHRELPPASVSGVLELKVGSSTPS